ESFGPHRGDVRRADSRNPGSPENQRAGNRSPDVRRKNGTKRGTSMRGFLSRLFGETTIIPVLSILAGLLVGAVIMLAGNYNPILAYGSLFAKAFGDLFNIGESLRQITPLLCTGLFVALSFRTGLFNIGAEGQFVVGALAAAYVGIMMPLPAYL